VNKEKLRAFADASLCLIGALAAIYICARYVLAAVLPFLFAWGIAFAVRPVARLISGRIKVSERGLRAVISVAVLLSLVSLTVFLIFRIGAEIISLFSGLKDNEAIMRVLRAVLNPSFSLGGSGDAASELEERLAAALSGVISSMLSGVSSFLTGFVSRIPGVLVFIVTLIISVVYFSVDLERINASVKSMLPSKMRTKVVKFKERSLDAALKYLRSYLLLMLITFVIILSGLLLLGQRYALLLAALIALLDILPVIGVGTVLVPWSAWGFISGDAHLGAGLAVLFLANELVRRFIEPRILGKSLGIHPLLTLVLIYACYSLLGIFGLLLMPVIAVVINAALAKDKPAEVE
jgi:sporulation integral membrane protein YtvI